MLVDHLVAKMVAPALPMVLVYVKTMFTEIHAQTVNFSIILNQVQRDKIIVYLSLWLPQGRLSYW